MTDRELLELAAKAAGIELWHEDVFTNGLTQKVSENGVLRWNPLTDDGDALRLSVKCGIDVFGDSAYRRAEIDNWNCAEPVGIDLYAATRRAIVKAAAEIGRSME